MADAFDFMKPPKQESEESSKIISGLFPNQAAANAPKLVGANGTPINMKGPGDGAEAAGPPTLETQCRLAECEDGAIRVLYRMALRFADGKLYPAPEQIGFARGMLERMLNDVKNLEKELWKPWIYEYYEKRRCCPNCGAVMFYDPIPGAHCDRDPNDLTPENYKDITEMKCECGWKGSLDALVGSNDVDSESEEL